VKFTEEHSLKTAKKKKKKNPDIPRCSFVYLCDGLADGHLTRGKVDADRLALPFGTSFLHSFWHCSCEQKHLQSSNSYYTK